VKTIYYIIESFCMTFFFLPDKTFQPSLTTRNMYIHYSTWHVLEFIINLHDFFTLKLGFLIYHLKKSVVLQVIKKTVEMVI